MATKVNKTFKVPAQPQKKIWSLSPKEMLFLDFTIFFSINHWELYKMVVKSDITDAQCRLRASALMTSFDGKDYIETRITQMSEFYWPEKEEVKDRKRGKDGFSEDFVPNVIKKLETIVNNPEDPNYFEGIKVALNKVLKDMQSENLSEPPQRYLPENCDACRYKVFCEQQCEDECTICKYRKYANENGVIYDYKDQLEKPTTEPEQETNNQQNK